MNFDYGTLLTRTLQITWKHKAFWAILLLPVMLSVPALPLVFGYFFVLEEGVGQINEMLLGIIGALLFLLLLIANVAVYAFSSSAVTLGVLRAENGGGSLNFITLLKDGLPYFWRQTALFLIFQFSLIFVVLALFACVITSSIVTMGLSYLCFQPLSLLLTPLIFLGMAVFESACTAVVQDDAGTMDALKRGLNVVRDHFWKYVFITLIIYILTMIISSLITFPMFLPFFFLILGMDSGMDIGNLFPLIMGITTCLFLPVMALFSVVSQTFMKTCLTLSYLRLAQPVEDALPKTS